MNQHQAIAAVTATLQRLLQKGREGGTPGLEEESVLIRSPGTIDPDDVPGDNGFVNLFLFQASFNAAWRNMDVPGKVKPGETGTPPLTLDLHYLLTAYGEDKTSPVSHENLGRAMSIFHDSPLLNADEIKYGSDPEYVHEQIERVRITPHPLSLDEMTKLWSTFQKDYRISAAYQVSVVMIESTRPTKTPVPVRRRGPEEQGTDSPESIGTQPSIAPPFPTILGLETAGGQPSLELGTSFLINGQNLKPAANEELVIRFVHPYLALGEQQQPLNPPSLEGAAIDIVSDAKVNVTLPSNFNIPPGVCRVFIEYRNTGSTVADRTSNEYPTSVAPTILDVKGCQKGSQAAIAVRLRPAVQLEYRIRDEPESVRRPVLSLLLGNEQVAFDNAKLATVFNGQNSLTISGITSEVPINTDAPVDVLVFVTDKVPPANSFVRLRVDGIDSLLIDDRTKKPPKFRETKVTISDPCP